MTNPTIQTGPDGTPTKTGLVTAGRAYIERWTAWMRENPDADPGLIARLMGAGEPPPGDSNADETAVSQWEKFFPAASEIYWIIRAALKEADRGKRAHHHRVAVLFIHASFPSKPDRDRLGLPSTNLELAELLGISDRTLRKYKINYPDIFSSTRATLRGAFLDNYYGRVYEAIGENALLSGRDGASDRRLFVQLTGDLGPSGSGDDPLNVQQIVTIREVRDADSDPDD